MDREIGQDEIARAGAAPPAPPPPPAQRDTSSGSGGDTEASRLTSADEGPAPVAQESRLMDQNWPFKGYDGPQPFEADNTPALTQNHLMVSSGAAGPEVAELADLLAKLGYTSSISHGQNPTNTYDDTVVGAVRAFCSEWGVEEDPAVRAARTPDTVGPWLWEALTRAVGKQEAEQG